MGIPVVCRMGPGFPHDSTRANRSRISEGAAHAFAARMVHAPERADPRVRMEFSRRESAGPCVGVLARLQNQRARGAARQAVFGTLFSKAAFEFHLVGEPQGRS